MCFANSVLFLCKGKNATRILDAIMMCFTNLVLFLCKGKNATRILDAMTMCFTDSVLFLCKGKTCKDTLRDAVDRNVYNLIHGFAFNDTLGHLTARIFH